MTTVRINPICDDVGLFGWDTSFSTIEIGVADWALAGVDEPNNRGGLSNKAALATDVVLSLYTEKSCPADHPLSKFADGNRGGWWGETLVEDDEPTMGSLLWLLDRAVVTEEMKLYADQFVQDALAHLVTSGACARIGVTVTAMPADNGFYIDISLYAKDGTKVYDYRYEPAWRQISGAY